MHRSTWIFTAATLMACQSGSISGDPDPVDVPDPHTIDPEMHTDVIMQSVAPVVDVLFVIDNSCSMGDDQKALSINAPSFMQWFVGSGLDYHIGVTSTDMIDPSHRGKLQEVSGLLWLDPRTPNPVELFRTLAVLGSGGAFPERGIDGAFYALEEEARDHNVGFQRNNSALHTVVISDEDDFSLDITPAEFVRWYSGLRAPSERSFSALRSPTCGASGCGYKYASAAEELGGEIWDVNADDWAEMLDRLGLRATGRRAEFFLSQLPWPDSVVVEIEAPSQGGTALVRPPKAQFDEDGTLLEGGWEYRADRNAILFWDYVPPDLSRIRITYAVRDGVAPGQPDDEPVEP